MEISFDPAKREATLQDRGLDFADAPEVFADNDYQFVDERRDYGETRVVTVGWLRERMVMVAWTQRGQVRHIISMRKANDREQARYSERLGRSG